MTTFTIRPTGNIEKDTYNNVDWATLNPDGSHNGGIQNAVDAAVDGDTIILKHDDKDGVDKNWTVGQWNGYTVASGTWEFPPASQIADNGDTIHVPVVSGGGMPQAPVQTNFTFVFSKTQGILDYPTLSGTTISIRVDPADLADAVAARFMNAIKFPFAGFRGIARNAAPAWVTGKLYAVPGTMVSAGGNRYASVTPGTSGGTAPTGTCSLYTPVTGPNSGTATGGGVGYIDRTGSGWTTNDFLGKYLRVTGGTGAGSLLQIRSNTATRIVTNKGVTFDATTVFEVVAPVAVSDGAVTWRWVCPESLEFVTVQQARALHVAAGDNGNLTVSTKIAAVAFGPATKLAGGVVDSLGLNTMTVPMANASRVQINPLWYGQVCSGTGATAGFNAYDSGQRGRSIFVNKAVTLKGEVDGEGNPITVIKNGDQQVVPFAYEHLWTGIINVYAREENQCNWLITGGNLTAQSKAKLENLKFDGGIGTANPVIGFKPFDEINIHYLNHFSLARRWVDLRYVYPGIAVGGWNSTDFTNPLISKITNVTLEGGIYHQSHYWTTSAVDYENCEMIKIGCEGYVPDDDSFGVGYYPCKVGLDVAGYKYRSNMLSALCFFQYWNLNWQQYIRDVKIRGFVVDGKNNVYSNERGSKVSYSIGMLGVFTKTGVTQVVGIDKLDFVGVDVDASGLEFALLSYLSSLYNSKLGMLVYRTSLSATGTYIKNVSIMDGAVRGTKKGGIRAGGVESLTIGGNAFVDNYDPNYAAAVVTFVPSTLTGAIPVANSEIVKNDYRDSNHPPMIAPNDSSLNACVFLGAGTNYCLVQETGSFPPGPTKIMDYVVDAGFADRIVGVPMNEFVHTYETPPGVGQYLENGVKQYDEE